jgi:hypothetical protein
MGCWSVAGCGGQCARVGAGHDRVVHQRPLTLSGPCRSKVTGAPNVGTSERGGAGGDGHFEFPELAESGIAALWADLCEAYTGLQRRSDAHSGKGGRL